MAMALQEQIQEQRFVRDTTLIQGILGGDSASFTELYRSYYPKSIAFAQSMIGDHAEDAVQDSWMKAWENIGSFEVGRTFLPWFLKIVRNSCYDKLRRNKRQRACYQTYREIEVADEEGFFRDFVEEADTAHHVRHALQKLTAVNREILDLRYFTGLSYEEIADVLQIPKGTVMSRLCNARKALQQKLSDIVRT